FCFARRKASTMRVSDVPSSGVSSPLQTAARIAAIASGASEAFSSTGRSISMGAPLRFGRIAPIRQPSALALPLFACSMKMTGEGLAIPLDELLQEDGCPVACAARAAGWIAALTWLEGHLFSLLVAGTKKPAMRGHHGQKNPARLPARAHVRK